MTRIEIENKLIELEPLKYSIQETSDSSYFFTLIFNQGTIYVEYFYDTNETVSISFKNKQNLENYAGEFQYVLNKILTLKKLIK